MSGRASPMEVDALTYPKVKGKGDKGKGKGDGAKSRGKGKKGYDGKGKHQEPRFEGACFNCGTQGHRASECRSAPSSATGKGGEPSNPKGKGMKGTTHSLEEQDESNVDYSESMGMLFMFRYDDPSREPSREPPSEPPKLHATPKWKAQPPAIRPKAMPTWRARVAVSAHRPHGHRRVPGDRGVLDVRGVSTDR
mgnify:CR=1 FL=1